MKLTGEDNSWATPGMREAPFWREGMTIDEYFEENDYLYMNFEKLQHGEYKTLYEQRKLGLIPPREETDT